MAWLIERPRSKVAHLSHGVDLLPLCGAENAAGQPYREVGIEDSRRPVCTRCHSIVENALRHAGGPAQILPLGQQSMAMTSADLDDMVANLPENVRWARFRRGLTQVEAGKQIGISYQAIGAIEKHGRIPTVDTLQRVVGWLESGPGRPADA